MTPLKTISKLVCGAFLMLTVSCSSNGFKLSQLNPMSVFTKDKESEEDTDMADAEIEESEEGPDKPKASGSRSQRSSKPEKPSGDLSPGETLPEPDMFVQEDRMFPTTVQARQPTVEITPPTKGGRPVTRVDDGNSEPEDKGGLRPRTPTLDIVPPGSP